MKIFTSSCLISSSTLLKYRKQRSHSGTSHPYSKMGSSSTSSSYLGRLDAGSDVVEADAAADVTVDDVVDLCPCILATCFLKLNVRLKVL